MLFANLYSVTTRLLIPRPVQVVGAMYSSRHYLYEEAVLYAKHGRRRVAILRIKAKTSTYRSYKNGY
jgi:hypothetical protein